MTNACPKDRLKKLFITCPSLGPGINDLLFSQTFWDSGIEARRLYEIKGWLIWSSNFKISGKREVRTGWELGQWRAEMDLRRCKELWDKCTTELWIKTLCRESTLPSTVKFCSYHMCSGLHFKWTSEIGSRCFWGCQCWQSHSPWALYMTWCLFSLPASLLPLWLLSDLSKMQTRVIFLFIILWWLPSCVSNLGFMDVRGHILGCLEYTFRN